MVGVDPQFVPDVHGPHLGPKVVLEVDLGTQLRARRLAILADHDEGREEDRFEADHHREEPEREAVEMEAQTGEAEVAENPHGEPDAVRIDEPHGAGETSDAIGSFVFGAAPGA